MAVCPAKLFRLRRAFFIFSRTRAFLFFFLLPAVVADIGIVRNLIEATPMHKSTLYFRYLFASLRVSLLFYLYELLPGFVQK